MHPSGRGNHLSHHHHRIEATTDGSKDDTLLTRREREMALLAARGLKNQQIAEELSISERTVGTHLSRVLHKLGLRSRAQITASMVEQHPSSED